MKQITTFSEFCKGIRNLNEEKAIEVQVEDWWEPCKDSVIRELKIIGGDPLNWDTLLTFARMRNQILGREPIYYVEDLLLDLIKSYIWQFGGEDIYTIPDEKTATQNSSLHTKGLAIETLAQDILYKVKVDAGLVEPEESSVDSVKPVASIKVGGGVPFDFDDDLPFEHNVIRYSTFRKLIKEAVCSIKSDHYSDCLDFILNELEKDAGGLELKEVLAVAKEKVEGKDDLDILNKYLMKLGRRYLRDKDDIQIKFDGVDITNNSSTTDDLIKPAKDLFLTGVVEDVKRTIMKGARG